MTQTVDVEDGRSEADGGVIADYADRDGAGACEDAAPSAKKKTRRSRPVAVLRIGNR